MGDRPTSPGQLNYLISMLISQYLDDRGTSYQTLNDVIGALEGAKLEFYRRIAIPYEEEKLVENGDVYGV
jgi:hypothetical protein